MRVWTTLACAVFTLAACHHEPTNPEPTNPEPTNPEPTHPPIDVSAFPPGPVRFPDNWVSSTGTYRFTTAQWSHDSVRVNGVWDATITNVIGRSLDIKITSVSFYDAKSGYVVGYGGSWPFSGGFLASFFLRCGESTSQGGSFWFVVKDVATVSRIARAEVSGPMNTGLPCTE